MKNRIEFTLKNSGDKIVIDATTIKQVKLCDRTTIIITHTNEMLAIEEQYQDILERLAELPTTEEWVEFQSKLTGKLVSIRIDTVIAVMAMEEGVTAIHLLGSSTPLNVSHSSRIVKAKLGI